MQVTSRAVGDRMQACWNCGRKATETCSGCNVARYCGSFCQHKDWETHHKICGSGPTSKPKTMTGSRSSQNNRLSQKYHSSRNGRLYQKYRSSKNSHSSQNSRSPTPGASQLEPPKQETTNDEAVADAVRIDGEKSSSPAEKPSSAEPTKREMPIETE